MSGRERRDLVALTVKKWIVLHHYSGSARPNERCKTRLNLGFRCRRLRDQLAPERLGCSGYFLPVLVGPVCPKSAD